MLIVIAGYSINMNKQVFIALSYIYGIGKSTGLKICKSVNIDAYMRAHNLTDDDVKILNNYISNNLKIGIDKRKEVLEFKKIHINNGSYRGKRLMRGLPCHGQRTRSNSRTCRRLSDDNIKS